MVGQLEGQVLRGGGGGIGSKGGDKEGEGVEGD